MKNSAVFVFLITLTSCGSDDFDYPNENSKQNDNDSLIIVSNATAEPDSVSFLVDDVDRAKNLLEVYESNVVFTNKLKKEIKFYPLEHEKEYFVPTEGNAMIETVHQAYDEHRPLCLTPDIIWLAICQGVAIHINENFDSLEQVIFNKNKPDKIIIRNDSLSNHVDQWQNIVNEFSTEISQLTKKNYLDFFVPNFSSTTQTIKTAYEINLMYSFQQSFTYIGESGCGIPEIKLKGTKKDWQKIKENLVLMDELGLKYWREELEPIIQQFIDVYENKIDLDFWKDIYKDMTDYNAFYISGWIIKFFPYITIDQSTVNFDDETGYQVAIKKFKKNNFIKGNQFYLSTLTTGNFPSGITDVEVTWNDYFNQQTVPMVLYSGFFATKQNKDMTLEPLISYAICEKNSKEKSIKYESTNSEKITHQDKYWTPHITKSVKSKPIYLPDTFSDHQASLLEFKRSLLDYLNHKFLREDIYSHKLTFVVLSNGKCENIKFSGKQEIQNEIELFLKQNTINWKPATAITSEVFQMWDQIYNTEPVEINVNFQIEISFK